MKIIDGGIDAYIEHQPLTKEDKVKVRMVAQAGNDLSVLVNGSGYQTSRTKVLLI